MDDAEAKDWAQRLTTLQLPHQEVARAIHSGADAASCSVFEEGGQVRFTTRTGEAAVATVKFRLRGERAPQVLCRPLTWVATVAAQGAIIEELSAPEPDSSTWTGLAWVIAEATLPAGLVLPARLRGPWMWLVIAQDDRGFGAAPLSLMRMPDGRLLGEALTGVLAKTQIEGAKARMDAARRNLGDNFSAIVASGAAEHFHDVAAVSGADGGPSTLEWQVLRRPLTSGAWKLVAGAPSTPRTAQSRRRGHLFDAILKEAEADAFGTGIDSPRGTRNITSLDQPIGEADATLGELLAGAPDVASGLEIDDLLAAARLTRREREVFDLQFVDGLTQAAIAERLGIAPGTVAALSSRAAKKVRIELAAT
jgi:hypothetical protein